MNSPRNMFRKSYGLVVLLTGFPEKVLIVERKIPYCVHNLFLKKMLSFFSKKYKSKNEISENLEGENWYRYVHVMANKILTTCKNETHIYDEDDFVKYEKGHVFEDQYDFPHGQMSTKTKRIFKNYIYEIYNHPRSIASVIEKDTHFKQNIFFAQDEVEDDEEMGDFVFNDDDPMIDFILSPTCQFLRKLTGFLTAFMEFEEETGYTFRFDLRTVLRLKTVLIHFTGLDGCDYLQKYYILRIDKLNKLSQPTYFNAFLNNDSKLSIKKRKESIFREIDRQTYQAKLLDVEKAVKLLYEQQITLKKQDLKHILPICLSNTQETGHKDEEEEEELEKIAEKMFLDLTKRIEPDIFERCVTRIQWRDKT